MTNPQGTELPDLVLNARNSNTEGALGNKGGRPFNSKSKYRADCPKKAYDILAKGGLLCHVAAGLKVDLRTISRWRKDHRKSKFATAIDEGLQVSEAHHADILAKLGRGVIKGNVAAQLRIMEYAFGWKNIQTVENVDPIKTLSQDELDQKIANLQKDTNVLPFKTNITGE